MKIRNLTSLSVATLMAISSASAQPKSSNAQLHDDMRKLWEDHITWTRLFIVSAVGGLPDLKQTTDRLMKNQDEIGAAVGTYYGSDAGTKLTALLKTHISTAGELVMAAKAADAAKTADAKRRWYANADEIALFLAAANPKHWPAATMQGAMKSHLDQTLDEATHRIQGNYAADIADYDRVHKHILMMADVLSDGIAAQFPSKVKGKR